LDNTPTKPNSTLRSYQMQRPRTNLKTQSIQSCERHTCNGHNAQTNDYFTTCAKWTTKAGDGEVISVHL